MNRLVVLLSLSLLSLACGPTVDDPDGCPDGVPNPPTVTVIDLGAGCLNAGDVEVLDDTAYVSCAGDFSGNGKLAIVDLTTSDVVLADVGGAPGRVKVTRTQVLLGDQLDGRIFVTDLAGTVIHDASDPVILCPSDVANNVFQFIPGVEECGGRLFASCFATDEVYEFTISAGAGTGGVQNAILDNQGVGGDGLSALRCQNADHLWGLDNLAGSVSHIPLNPFSVTASKAAAGDVPNDLLIDGDTAFIVNSVSNTLMVLDLLTDTVTSETHTGDNTNPWSLAALGNGRYAVSLLLSDEVAIVDTNTSEVVECVPMPTGADLKPFAGVTPSARPQGIDVTSDGRVVVSLSNLDANDPFFPPGGHGLLVVLEWSQN